jgi:hypothetical protein
MNPLEDLFETVQIVIDWAPFLTILTMCFSREICSASWVKV